MIQSPGESAEATFSWLADEFSYENMNFYRVQRPRRYKIPTTPFQESHNGLIQYLVLFLWFHFEFCQTANDNTLFDKIQNAEKQFLHCITTT